MNGDSSASFSASSTISIFSSLSTSLASCPDRLPNLEACAYLTFRLLVGYRGTMHRRRKNPRLCLLLNSGLWHRCSLRKCGSPQCSCPFLYKYWYSPISSSRTYCPQSRDSSSYIKSVMSLHCSQMPRPTRFSSLTICTTRSPCFASISVPTSTAFLHFWCHLRYFCPFIHCGIHKVQYIFHGIDINLLDVRIYTGPVCGVPLLQTCLIANE